MNKEDSFVMPIMKPNNEAIDCPINIPFSLLNEKQAFGNHGQTLIRLADRGGLSPCEAVAIIENRRYKRMEMQEAINILNKFINAVLDGE